MVTPRDCRARRACAYDRPMSLVQARKLIEKPGRFAYLMGLYAENYWRLTRVFDPQQL
jgi:hypothetical protein